MTTTVNSQCSSIEINSELFAPANISNTLYVSVNGASETTITITANASSFTLEPSDLDVEQFAQGVYQLRLVSVAFNSVSTEEISCTSLLCDLLCDVDTLAWYSSKDTFDKALALEGLKNASNCSECNCTIMQTLYNFIIDDNNTSCGCCCTTV